MARENEAENVSGVETGERDSSSLVRNKGGRTKRPELSREEEMRLAAR